MNNPTQRLRPYAIDGGCDAYGQMEDDPSGDYVRYEDYEALAARLESSQNEDVVCGELYREAVRQCDELRHQHYKAHAAGKAEGLRQAADMVASSAYTSSNSGTYLARVSKPMEGRDMHHETIATAILTLIPATTGGNDAKI
jgi:hypothetical protein